jgi:Fur family ferric uptake transcriptional regulator
MAKARPKTAAETDGVKALLRAAGLRATGARVAVFEHLRKSKRPESHGEVADAVAGRGFDRATVYRNLIDLVEAGFVDRTDLGDHMWRFALRSGDGAHGVHPHFTCTDCGTVECLPEVEVKVTQKGRAPRAVAKAVEVQLKGRCDDCD